MPSLLSPQAAPLLVGRGRLPQLPAGSSRPRSNAIAIVHTKKGVLGEAALETGDKKPSFDSRPADVQETMRQRRQQDVSMTLAATSRPADPGICNHTRLHAA